MFLLLYFPLQLLFDNEIEVTFRKIYKGPYFHDHTVNPFIRIVQDTYIDTRSKQRFYGHKRMTRAYSCDLHMSISCRLPACRSSRNAISVILEMCYILDTYMYLWNSTFIGYKHVRPCDLGIMTQIEKGVTVCVCVRLRVCMCALLSLLLVPRFHSHFSVKLRRSDATVFWCCVL